MRIYFYTGAAIYFFALGIKWGDPQNIIAAVGFLGLIELAAMNIKMDRKDKTK